MSESVFTPEEAKELARLLRKIPKDNYFIPEAAFEPFHGVASMWAPELVILHSYFRHKEIEESFKILLTVYKGGADFFKGLWHIPGGYNRWNEPDIQATCNKVAHRELGVNVKAL